MFRNLERCENTARFIEAGVRIALTHSPEVHDEWESVVTTAGQRQQYLERHDRFDSASCIDFLLRDETNSSSVRETIDSARTNARGARTALTREVWEATNSAWMTIRDALADPIPPSELPRVLSLIRDESAIVRGSLIGTMLRNDGYNFCRIGTFVERADSTARILDVKYHVLLPAAHHVGSRLDNVQWETILRSVSAQRAFRWSNGGEITPMAIAKFLILDPQSPRSLIFCYRGIENNLDYLAGQYGHTKPCHDTAKELRRDLSSRSIESIFDAGLHEFLAESMRSIADLGSEIETDYRFIG